MNSADLATATIALRKGEVRHLGHARGRRVEALSGCLWLTFDNDLRDIFVTPGHGFRIDADGDALLSAADDSRFLLLDPPDGGTR